MISLFSEKYNRAKYLEYLKTYLLPDDFQVNTEDVTGQLSFKANKINQVTYLGKSKALELAIFEMHHDSENDPRVTISRDAFKILASFNHSRALVFFTSPQALNYRLSLITIDLKLEDKKVKRFFSNPRRYSFLLGNDAKLGTLYDKLVKSQKIENTKQITDFADLLGRFAVEPVTKEFFNKYKELYDLVINEFEKSNNFKIVMSKTEGFNSDIFARKLLGQITFLYFLQKKKWLGGDPSNTETWSDGRQDFLRWGFDKCKKEGFNYFDKFLEKLFYEGLNQVGDSFKFNDAFLKIPYLNGGLFECPYEYDETIIFAPSNDLFSNDKDTGILDIFDQYNFTIDENTYFEQDIAIDPEMLGKVFENLLDDINRKGKGAFYTPREIVNYMTRESLKQFLITKLQDKENIEEKLDHLFEYKDLYLNKGDFANDEQEKEFEKQFNELFDIVEDVNKLLINIKIADPAVGSGAFPMGILHEIVSIRSYIKDEFLNEHANLYQLKKETIQKCIYGVDIDNGAIEIAKIRFWLSLVVDADIPEALPNFDYKFMQGNSLIESFGGININQVRTKYSDLEKKDEEITNEITDINQEIQEIQKKFFDEFSETSIQNQILLDQIKALEKQKKTLSTEKKKLATELNKNSLLLEEDQMIDHLHYLQEKLYQEDNKSKKFTLRNEIEDTIVKIFKTRIENDKNEYFQAYNQMINTANQFPTNEQRERFIQEENIQLKKKYKFDYQELESQLHEFTKKNKIRPFFPWHLYFADVFKENGGFDIVIGNPPYRVIDRKESTLYIDYYTLNTLELYSLFFEKSISDLLKDQGTISFITASLFIKGIKFSKLREFLEHSLQLNKFFIAGDKVFENVQIPTSVLIGTKSKNNQNWQVEDIIPNYKILCRIEENTLPLSKVMKIKRGFEIGRANVSSIGQYKMVTGSDIKQWNIKQIKYISEETYQRFKKDEYYFNGERILIRETGSKLVTLFLDEKLYCNRSLYSLKLKNKAFSTRYLLGLLSSNIMQFYYSTKFKSETDIFPKIRIAQVKLLPLKYSDDKIQKVITELINNMIDTQIDNKVKSKVQLFINLIVYKIYNLPIMEIIIIDPEIDTILSDFGLTSEQYEKMSVEEIASLETGVPQP